MARSVLDSRPPHMSSAYPAHRLHNAVTAQTAALGHDSGPTALRPGITCRGRSASVKKAQNGRGIRNRRKKQIGVLSVPMTVEDIRWG